MKGHNREECNNDPKCPNRGDDHHARSFNCTRYKEEETIWSLMSKDKISSNNVRKIYKFSKAAVHGKSFAAADYNTKPSSENCNRSHFS